MERFHFRFASVQKVRRIEMDLQARALAEAMQVVQRIDTEIEQLKKSYQIEVDRLKNKAESASLSQVQMGYQVSYREHLIRLESDAMARRRKALKQVEEERQKLIEREQKKKVFDKLEERDREMYEQKLRKYEQIDLDEMASRCTRSGVANDWFTDGSED